MNKVFVWHRRSSLLAHGQSLVAQHHATKIEDILRENYAATQKCQTQELETKVKKYSSSV